MQRLQTMHKGNLHSNPAHKAGALHHSSHRHGRATAGLPTQDHTQALPSRHKARAIHLPAVQTVRAIQHHLAQVHHPPGHQEAILPQAAVRVDHQVVEAVVAAQEEALVVVAVEAEGKSIFYTI
jgi:hypothetical protein